MPDKGAYYVLTGGRNSGKTLICNDLAAEAHARDMDVAGILTSLSGPEPQAPREVIDLRTGASRLFGVPTRSSGDSLTPGWSIKQEVFEWANGVLRAAVPCELLIIDEIGPLELEGGRGWVAALEVVRGGRFGAALVVCRPNLLEKLEESLNGPPAALFRANPDNSITLPDIILERMFGSELCQ